MPTPASSNAAKPTVVRPIQRFASAAAKCGPESAAYGRCILTDYRNVTRDMCATEFLRLKECYLKHAKQR